MQLALSTSRPAYERSQLSMETDKWREDLCYTDYLYYAALYCTTYIGWRWAVEVITENFCSSIYRQALSALVYMQCKPLQDSFTTLFRRAVERGLEEQSCLQRAIEKTSLMQHGLSALLGVDVIEQQAPPPRALPAPEPEPQQSAPPTPQQERPASSGLRVQPPSRRRHRSRGQQTILRALDRVNPDTKFPHLITAIAEGNEQVALDLIEQLEASWLTKQDKEGVTPLMCVIAREKLALATAIVNKLSAEQVSIADRNHMTALIILVSLESSTMDQLGPQLIDKMTAEQLNHREKNGVSALRCAISSEKGDLARRIVEKLTSEHLRGEKNILSLVYKYNQIDVGFSIAQKLSLDLSRDYIALMCAIMKRDQTQARQLIDGIPIAMLRKQDLHEISPMRLAIQRGLPDLSRGILQKINPQGC